MRSVNLPSQFAVLTSTRPFGETTYTYQLVWPTFYGKFSQSFH